MVFFISFTFFWRLSLYRLYILLVSSYCSFLPCGEFKKYDYITIVQQNLTRVSGQCARYNTTGPPRNVRIHSKKNERKKRKKYEKTNPNRFATG